MEGNNLKVDTSNIVKQAKRSNTGKQGEDLASAYLLQKTYKILARNYRAKRDEIDIIALTADGKTLVFVEVKSRREPTLQWPELAVTSAKQKCIFRAADQYLGEFPSQGEVRFDVIGITYLSPDAGNVEIFHLEDAFYPGMEEY